MFVGKSKKTHKSNVPDGGRNYTPSETMGTYDMESLFSMAYENFCKSEFVIEDEDGEPLSRKEFRKRFWGKKELREFLSNDAAYHAYREIVGLSRDEQVELANEEQTEPSMKQELEESQYEEKEESVDFHSNSTQEESSYEEQLEDMSMAEQGIETEDMSLNDEYEDEYNDEYKDEPEEYLENEAELLVDDENLDDVSMEELPSFEPDFLDEEVTLSQDEGDVDVLEDDDTNLLLQGSVLTEEDWSDTDSLDKDVEYFLDADNQGDVKESEELEDRVEQTEEDSVADVAAEEDASEIEPVVDGNVSGPIDEDYEAEPSTVIESLDNQLESRIVRSHIVLPEPLMKRLRKSYYLEENDASLDSEIKALKEDELFEQLLRLDGAVRNIHDIISDAKLIYRDGGMRAGLVTLLVISEEENRSYLLENCDKTQALRRLFQYETMARLSIDISIEEFFNSVSISLKPIDETYQITMLYDETRRSAAVLR